MEELIKIIFIFLLFSVIAVLAGSSIVYVFNRLPAKWLCDYGEEPSEELADISRQRLNSHPWKLVFTAFFAVCGIYMCTLGGKSIEYVIPLLICVWLLIMIAIADHKYMIIPDQFVVFLMLMSIAFMPFGVKLKAMLLGGLTGAGIMLLVAVSGYFISRRESLGFGDIKLMFAVGMLTGVSGCIAIMAAASVFSGSWFAIQLVRGKAAKNEMRPFGPFLAGCAIVYLLVFH